VDLRRERHGSRSTERAGQLGEDRQVGMELIIATGRFSAAEARPAERFSLGTRVAFVPNGPVNARKFRQSARPPPSWQIGAIMALQSET